MECLEGWKDLYEPLFEYVEEYNKGKPKEEQLEVVQVKQKFGMLEFYVDGKIPQKFKDLRSQMRAKSMTTCEVCGKEGKQRSVHGWIYTRCDDCFDKLMETKGLKRK